MDPFHLEQLCREFELGSVQSIEEDTQGALNRNFLLATSTGSYFIKSVRERRKSHIPHIAETETFFQGKGIPAVCMLRNASGALSMETGGDVYTVYPYVPNDNSCIYALQNIDAMGAMLGSLHLEGSRNVPDSLATEMFTIKGAQEVIEKLTAYRDGILHKEFQDAVDAEFLTYIDLKLSKLSQEVTSIALPNDTLTHGDYHERNILFEGEKGIIGICDWEKAQMAPKAYELARAVEIICLGFSSAAVHTADEMLSTAARFISAYRSVYPISAEEIQVGFDLQLQKTLHSIWIEHQHYDLKDFRSDKFIQHEKHRIESVRDRIE